VRRIVAIELGAAVNPPDAPATITQVRLLCESGLYLLRMEDPVTGKSLARRIEPAALAPSARERLLALAIAELVSASWTELEWNPEPAVEPAGPRATPEVRQAALEVVRIRAPLPAPKSSLRVAAVLDGRSFPSGPDLLLGGGVRLAQDRGSHLTLCIDVLVDRGTAQVPIGEVAVDTVTASARVQLEQRFALVALHAGAGLRAGWAQLEGRTQSPQVMSGSVAGPSGGVLGAAGARLGIARRLSLEVVGEGGWVLFPITGRVGGVGSHDVALDGAWVGAQLAVGVIL